jgi:hypothetical protein
MPSFIPKRGFSDVLVTTGRRVPRRVPSTPRMNNRGNHAATWHWRYLPWFSFAMAAERFEPAPTGIYHLPERAADADQSVWFALP